MLRISPADLLEKGELIGATKPDHRTARLFARKQTKQARSCCGEIGKSKMALR
jgi:hypothetical protein